MHKDAKGQSVAELRAEILKKRKMLTTEKNLEASLRVTKNLIKFFNELKIDSENIIGSYKAKKNSGEISIEFSEHLFINPLAFPRVKSFSDRIMDFCLCHHETDFQESAFNILEPRKELLALKISEIDLFLIPGLLFSEKGARIGYGMGFYDRLLANAPQCLRVGIAHEFQVFLDLKTEHWDQKMDYVITPERIIDCHSLTVIDHDLEKWIK